MIKRCFLQIVLSLLLIASAFVAKAQEGMRFRTVSPKGGFYYDGVSSISQDGEDYIWVMLENELLRYDGYDYINYSFKFDAFPDSSRAWKFNYMDATTTGLLHVIASNSLYVYDPKSDLFKIADNGPFSMICSTPDGNLWCVHNGSLKLVSLPGYDMTMCQFDEDSPRVIPFMVRSDGKMFCATRDGKVYRTRDNAFKQLERLHDLVPKDQITGLAAYKEKLFVLTEGMKVLRYDTRRNELEETIDVDYLGLDVPINSFTTDSNGRLFIGSLRGLVVLNPVTGEQHLYRHSQSDPMSIPNNSVWDIFEDKAGNIWFGHYAGGLSVVDVEDNLSLKSYNPDFSGLSENLVSCFAEDAAKLYVGTEGGGINIVDKRTGTFSYLKHGIGINTLSHNNVKSLLIDCNNRLWIAMFRGGLDCYDIKDGVFRHFRHNQDNSLGLLDDNLRKIVPENESGLWIAYQSSRAMISYLSFATEEMKHFTLGPDEFVYDIHKDNSTGYLWILTRTRLYRLNTHDGSILEEHTPFISGQTLCTDEEGNVWIGSFGKGLVKYESAKHIFTYTDDLSKYNVSAVFSICFEASGRLWMGTDNGLLCYDISSSIARKYDESDGMQGQVYYPLSSMVGIDDCCYFGGTRGFSVLSPSSVSLQSTPPAARISIVTVDGNQTTIGTMEDKDSEIKLDWNHGNISFTFSSDNYRSPEKNHFRYRLKGYSDKWTTVSSSSRTVSYSKLPAGKYTLEYQASNADDKWGEISRLQITRKRAPWASIPALLLYVFSLLAISAFGVHYIIEKRRMKMQMYKDSLERQKNEAIHQSQLRFFTNVSHDFRTPLSLILAAVENIKKDKQSDQFNYQILKNNSQRLLNLVNDLMDFRLAESKKMKLIINAKDINSFVFGIASDFEGYAKRRNILFRIDCDSSLDKEIPFDGKLVEKVIFNLMSNAFRYTEEGGEIRVMTYSDSMAFTSKHSVCFNTDPSHDTSHDFAIVVSDTGIGISEESISKVFDRYYTVDDNKIGRHLGTGIGLALVNQIVHIHKGIIKVYSERGKGTDFIIYLPASSSCYTADELSDTQYIPEANVENSLIIDAKTDSPLILPEQPNRNTILIVEDNKDLCSLLSGFLSLNYNVRSSHNGQEAIDILSSESIDLVLSDIMMPIMDGVTLCKQIKGSIETSHIPVVLLTAKSSDEARLEGADSGADLYFTKPINMKLLLKSIRNVFQHRSNVCDYYSKHYWAENSSLSTNKQDTLFLDKLTKVIDENLSKPDVDVNKIASQLCMSRTKLFEKLKALTGKNIVEFSLNYRLRKAARLLKEGKNINEVTEMIGLHSRSYFDKVFKKEFGVTPAKFVSTKDN